MKISQQNAALWMAVESRNSIDRMRRWWRHDHDSSTHHGLHTHREHRQSHQLESR